MTPAVRGAQREPGWSGRDQELWSSPSVASQMPVRFEGAMEWQDLVGYCNGCGDAIPAADFRGLVTRPLARVACVEAVGVCRRCRLLTHFAWRLHPDGSVTGVGPNGRWGTWRSQPGWLARLRRGWRKAGSWVRAHGNRGF